MEIEEVGARDTDASQAAQFFFLLIVFFGRYPTHHCHISMKTASTTDYTVVWVLDTFFLYKYILPTNTFIFF